MTNRKTSGHILKPMTIGEFLAPVQKRIFLNLAQNNPQTIYETDKKIKGHYKSSWNAFKALKKKGLIQAVTSENYRGRDYPHFWLTESGVLLALCEGVKQLTLMDRTLAIYPENKDLLCLLEVIPILGQNAFDVAYLGVLRKGKFQPSDITAIFGAQIQSPFSPEQTKQISDVLKKYPELYQRCKDRVKLTLENLKKLDNQF